MTATRQRDDAPCRRTIPPHLTQLSGALGHATSWRPRWCRRCRWCGWARSRDRSGLTVWFSQVLASAPRRHHDPGV